MGAKFSALAAWVAVIAVMIAFLVVVLYGCAMGYKGV